MGFRECGERVLCNASSMFGIKGFDDGYKAPEWKRFTSMELGINNKLIPRPARVVLDGLKRKGNFFKNCFFFKCMLLRIEMNCYVICNLIEQLFPRYLALETSCCFIVLLEFTRK